MAWHEHYDTAGNLTGKTKVTTPSLWDDLARSEALALIAAEDTACKTCGQPDAMVRVRSWDRYINWGDGSRWLVKGFRCLACMALDMRRRDLDNAEKDHKPTAGVYAPSDGRRLVVRRAQGKR